MGTILRNIIDSIKLDNDLRTEIMKERKLKEDEFDLKQLNKDDRRPNL